MANEKQKLFSLERLKKWGYARKEGVGGDYCSLSSASPVLPRMIMKGMKSNFRSKLKKAK